MPGELPISIRSNELLVYQVTILNQNIQAFLHSQGGIEDDKAKAEREDIVTCANFEEVANGTLDEGNISSAFGSLKIECSIIIVACHCFSARIDW